MRRIARVCLLLLAPALAAAHQRLTTAAGVPLFRPDHQRIRFLMNSEFTAGSRNADGQIMLTTGSDPQTALRQALAVWSNVANSAIRFTPLDTTATGRNGQDQQHVLLMQDTPALRSAVGDALAVALYSFSLSDGRITDSDIVFNPRTPFSTTGAAGTYDLRSIAVHEIGHTLGAQHFVYRGAPMLHYTSPGLTTWRILSSDEEAFASSVYPMPAAPLLLGSISGTVLFEAGGPVRGAVVTAADPATGVTVGAWSSRSDGTYAITGLPPGRYQVYVEPLDGPVRPASFGAPDSAVDTVFQPRFFGNNASPTFVEVAAGGTGRADISVTRGAGTIGIQRMGNIPPGSNTYFFGTGAELVRAGQSHDMLIFGPGFDETINASNIRLLGPGLSIRPGSVRLDRGLTAAGFPAVRLVVEAAQRTSRLMASVVLTKGSEIAVVSGGLLVTVPEPAAPPPIRLDTVNGASLAIAAMAPDSFATLFGANLADRLMIAETSPFPTDLGGTRVLIRDRTGTEHAAGLVFVSPNQVNLLVPTGIVSGLATLRVVTAGQPDQSLAVLIEAVSPGLFTANADGRGAPLAYFIRVNRDGSRSEGFLYQTTEGRPPQPIDLGEAGDQVYLILFGTGMRGLTEPATMRIRNVEVPVLSASAQGQFAGLDQVNVGPIPRSLAGAGEVDAVVMVDGKTTNAVRIHIR